MARAGRRFLLRPTRPVFLTSLHAARAVEYATAAPTIPTGTATALAGSYGVEAGAGGATATASVYALAGGYEVEKLSVRPGTPASIMPLARALPGHWRIPGVTIIGDSVNDPVKLTALSSDASLDLMNTTLESGEVDTGTSVATQWFYHVTPGLITITAGYGYFIVDQVEIAADGVQQIIETWESPSTGGTHTFLIGGGPRSLLRFRDTSGAFGARVSFTYALEPVGGDNDDVPTIRIRNPQVFQCPTKLVVDGMDFTGSDPVSFTVVGEPLTPTYLITADGAGSIINGTIPVNLDAGTYTLKAQGTANIPAFATFSVANDLAPMTPMAADVPPTPVTGTKWVLQDPAPGGLATYVFTRNPSQMTDPNPPPRPLIVERTSLGLPAIWQGTARGRDWKFSGRVRTEGEYLKILEWAGLERRFYTIDHRNRAWITTWDAVTMTPVRDPDYPYSHDYEVTATVYGQGEF